MIIGSLKEINQHELKGVVFYNIIAELAWNMTLNANAGQFHQMLTSRQYSRKTENHLISN